MAGFNMKAISIVDPSNEAYEGLDVQKGGRRSRPASTTFYNEVIEAYNESPVNSLLLIPLPEGIRYNNLVHILAGRGLTADDVIITRQETDTEGNVLPKAQRPAKLKKLSDKEGKIV